MGGMRSSAQADGGPTSRVVGSLLNWLSEPHPGVFVIASANEVRALAPEQGVARVRGGQMLLDLLHPHGRVVVGRYCGLRPARWRLAHLCHRTDVAQAAEGSIG